MLTSSVLTTVLVFCDVLTTGTVCTTVLVLYDVYSTSLTDVEVTSFSVLLTCEWEVRHSPCRREILVSLAYFSVWNC